MMRTRIVVVGLIFFAGPLARAQAVGKSNSLTDGLGARSMGTGEAGRADAFGSAATHLNPAGAALARSYVLEGDGGYRAEDDTLWGRVSVCDSVSSVIAACVYYDYFAGTQKITEQTRDRTLHEGGLTLALPVSPYVLLGVNNKYVDYSESGSAAASGDSTEGYLLDAGVLVRPTSSFRVAAVGYNLAGDPTAQFPRGVGAGLAFRTASLLLAADAVWNLDEEGERQTGRYGGGAEYLVASAAGQAGFPLRAGYVYDAWNGASYVTGGLGYVTSRAAFDLGARVQVDAGSERMARLSVRFFLPE
jgi:hypothetical protein